MRSRITAVCKVFRSTFLSSTPPAFIYLYISMFAASTKESMRTFLFIWYIRWNYVETTTQSLYTEVSASPPLYRISTFWYMYIRMKQWKWEGEEKEVTAKPDVHSNINEKLSPLISRVWHHNDTGFDHNKISTTFRLFEKKSRKEGRRGGERDRRKRVGHISPSSAFLS